TLPCVRHDGIGGYLIPWQHKTELIEQNRICRLKFHNIPGSVPQVGTIHKTAADDARRIIQTIRDFLDDSRAVLARSSDHCCVCGRGLTDELSRSRGIGPECFKRANIMAILAADRHPNAPSFTQSELVG